MKTSLVSLSIATLLLFCPAFLSEGFTGETGEEKKDLPTAGYDKNFFVQSPDGKYKLSPSARVQFRYTFNSDESYEDNKKERGNYNKFEITRARLVLKGNVF